MCRALLLAAMLPLAAQASPAPGTLIVNTASITDVLGNTSSATVSAQIEASVAAPVLDILQYAPPGSPNAGLATTVAVPSMSCNGSPYFPTYSSFATGVLPAPASMPLFTNDSSASKFNVGEPLFLRVTYAAANTNAALVDEIQVTVTDSITHDSEVLTLEETGANTGVFTGYVNTAASAVQAGDCVLSATGADVVTVTYGGNVQQTAAMADPTGVVFDDQSGAVLDHVMVTLVDAVTNQPVAVVGDDGTPNFPNPVMTGHQGYTVGALTYSFGQGRFRFPNVSATGNYKLLVSRLSHGYVAPGRVPAANSAAAAMNYVLDPNASFGKTFALVQGQAAVINIPLDKPTTGLYVAKSAGASSAAIGDFVPYTVLVSNTNSSTIAAVSISDHLPPGLRYRAHTLQVNGVSVPDPVISADGSTLTAPVGDIAAAATTSITYAVEITAATPRGTATNRVQASSPAITSNVAQATIVITEDLMRSSAVLTGRVWEGETCDAADRKPLAGARIYLEDGSYVITDANGKWHLDNIRPGTHVVQLDKASLTPDLQLLSCEKHTRSAGNNFSQFVDVQGGTLWQTDFHVRRLAPPEPIRMKIEETDQRIMIRLMSAPVDRGVVRFTLRLRNPATEISDATLSLKVPESLEVVPGSWKVDDEQHEDLPVVDGEINAASVGALIPSDEGHLLSWDMKIRKHPVSGKQDITVMVVATTPAGDISVGTRNVATIEIPEKAGRVIVFHPHFASYSTDLAAADKKWLDNIAKELSHRGEIHVEVVGHTDNVKVVPRKGRAINDNTSLSKARASSVAAYLAVKLRLDEAHISSTGKGPDEPVQDNKTAAGRAANRRVELKVAAVARITSPRVSMLQADSGEKSALFRHWVALPDDDPGPPAAAKAGAPQGTPPPASAATAAPDKQKTDAGDPAGVAASEDSEKAAAEIAEEQLGILSVHDGDVLANRVYPVRFRMSNRLTPQLSIDGHVVSAERVGFQKNDGKTTLTVYIGVDFGEPGTHELTLKGMDPFGNPRFTQSFKIIRPGEVTRLHLVSAEGNVADGKTPVRMRVELIDSSGKAFVAATDLKVLEGNLQPQASVMLDKGLNDQGPKVSIGSDGVVNFAPVAHSGLYTVTLGYNNVSERMSVYVRPEKRDWIMVGLAEGSLAEKSLGGNVEALSAAGESKDIWQDGRVAFFAKGQVRGDWLLTLAYDTARNRDTQAFGQVINPTQYYTVYADASTSGFDAPSKAKLYIRMERDAFYLLFGDFSTGLTESTLSAYNRTMTGLKTEYHDQRYDLSLYAADSDQSFVRRDLRGDGTSGIYHLGDTGIMPGSEKVRIETRDRLRPDVILSTQQLSPYADYTFDYLTGELFFRSPVLSQDNNFNPIFIVAEYEVQAGGRSQLNAGGRAAVNLAGGKATVGVTAVHESAGSSGGDLHGLDARYKVSPIDVVKAEVAESHADSLTNGPQSGVAHLLEWKRNTKNLVSRVYFSDQGSGFGLGQQSSSTVGLRSYGAEERYQVTRFWSMIATLLNQDSLATGASRRSLEVAAEYRHDQYSAQMGLRNATDNYADGTSQTSTQTTLSGRYDIVPNKVSMHANAAVGLHQSGSQDFPDLLLVGADYKVTKTLVLNADQQYTWSQDQNTASTRVGAVWAPWKGANFGEHVEHDVDESGDRIMSSLGLGQSVKLSKEWVLESTYDRADMLKDSVSGSSTAPAQSVIPAATPAYGPATTNFWAAAVGGQYQELYTKATLRAEHREATNEKRWNLVGAIYHELDPQLAMAGGLQVTTSDAAGGEVNDTADLRWSLAWRPDRVRWVVLNRVDLVTQTLKNGASDVQSRRIINNLNGSRRWDADQLSLQYGAKYALATIDSANMSGYTDLMGAEWRHDIRENWDVGAQTSLLHSWGAHVMNNSYGISVGYTPVHNVWISLGYNFEGVSDRDFSGADYTAKGIYLKLRAKVDQDSIKQIWQSARGGVFW
jgi:uncharacterized repeat protein (TIGR01451 family)